MTENSKQSVAVLGSGVTGLHLALLFREKGFRVRVFSSKEKNMASLASHGIVSHKGHVLPRDSLFSSKLEGASLLLSRIKFLESKLGLKIPFNKGLFEVFETKKEELLLRRRAYHGAFTGCMQSRLFSGEVFRKETPLLERLLDKKPTSALFYPFDFSFDPQTYLSFLRIYLEKQGVFFEEAEISSLEEAKKGLFLVGKEKKALFDHVLCALGAETGSFARASGLDLEPLSISEGFTIRSLFKEAPRPFSLLYKRKNLSLFGKSLVLGSFPSSSKGLALSELFPGLSSEVLALFSSSSCLFSGKRVYGKSRSPVLQCFQRDNGSKVVILTGMYKNGFSLSELYAKKALSFF